MTPAELEKTARSGDVLAVKSEGVGGLLVRLITGESYSHVAVLVWGPDIHGNILRVYEFIEGDGYKVSTLAEWLKKHRGELIWYGQAPEAVIGHQNRTLAAAEYYRTADRLKRAYGWWSLIKIWVSQVIRLRIPVRQKVCSTFVQEVWRLAGYDGIRRTADPGDIAESCRALIPVEFAK